MRLGDLRTRTREFDGRQLLCLSDYSDGTVKLLELDMITDNECFFRVVDDE